MKVKSQLRKLQCSKSVRFKIDQLLDNVEFSEKQVVTKEIRKLCQNDPELAQCMKYMMSVCGIGWIVASRLLARIGDWRELKNVRQLAGFLGVVPTENSTGEKTDRGSITRTGTAGCGVSSSRPPGRRFARMASFGILQLGLPQTPAACGSAGRHRGGGAQAQRSDCCGVDGTTALCGETKSSFGSFDPRGDIAPGNDSTTRRTGRQRLLTVRSLRQRSRGLVP